MKVTYVRAPSKTATVGGTIPKALGATSPTGPIGAPVKEIERQAPKEAGPPPVPTKKTGERRP